MQSASHNMSFEFLMPDDEIPDDNRSGTRTAAGGRQQRAGRTTCPGAGERVSS